MKTWLSDWLLTLCTYVVLYFINILCIEHQWIALTFKPIVTWLAPWNYLLHFFFFFFKNTNLARGLKNGWGRLVYTILISNLTRLIHWPIHISKLKKHQNTSIKHITIILHSPKTTITKTTLLLHGLLNLLPYLQSEGEGSDLKKLNERYIHLLKTPLKKRKMNKTYIHYDG